MNQAVTPKEEKAFSTDCPHGLLEHAKEPGKKCALRLGPRTLIWTSLIRWLSPSCAIGPRTTTICYVSSRAVAYSLSKGRSLEA